MKKPTLLVDMDGTIVDLHGYALKAGVLDHYPCRWDMACCIHPPYTTDDMLNMTSLFEYAPPIPGALKAITDLELAFDVWIVSTPWPSNPDSSAAKTRWCRRHLGTANRLILTQDKTMVRGDILVDDKPALVGPWRHVEYPQPWNSQRWMTWDDGLADQILDFAALLNLITPDDPS